jgi:hypothetical protein
MKRPMAKKTTVIECLLFIEIGWILSGKYRRINGQPPSPKRFGGQGRIKGQRIKGQRIKLQRIKGRRAVLQSTVLQFKKASSQT